MTFLHSILGTSRALSMFASGIARVPSAVSIFSTSRVDAAQHALDASRVADRLAQLELRLARRRNAQVIGFLLQRAGRVRAMRPRAGRKRRFSTREQMREMVAHTRAILDVDTRRACR